MQTTIRCDYSVGKFKLADFPGEDLSQIEQYCDKRNMSAQQLLFLIVPDAAMPEVSDSDDVGVSVDLSTDGVLGWSIIDDMNGQTLLYQLGSKSKPLASDALSFLQSNGFIVAAFINSRSGTPKGFRLLIC